VGQPLVEVRGLSLALGEFAVREIDLEVREREYFVLLGPTGAGKTVVVECIAGLHRPRKGEILLAGERVNRIPPEERGLGYLPQDYALFPHLTVAGNIAFGMRVHRRPGAEVERRVGELAGLLGIAHLLDRWPLHLSGGEKQRVALARALAIEPKLLLLDEPLSALDEQTREGLCLELRRVHAELGTTTLHVSHNFEETLALADRIGIMHEGRMRQVGTPEEVFRRPGSEFVAHFVRSQNVFPGTAQPKNGRTEVRIGELRLVAEAQLSGSVCLTIRPEEVALLPSPPPGETNLLEARVKSLLDRGALVRVDLEAEIPLVALVPRQAVGQLSLRAGKRVWAHLPPASTHVFPRGGA
jgi:ABC-type Fe3+/spermidine/putrescine transport system ATPase subunit